REFTRDRFGSVTSTTPVGGNEEILLTNEIIFPLVPAIGLKGVMFVDAGNAYGTGGTAFGEKETLSIDNTRLSAGGGVRWLSPLGPLRVDLGVPFNTKAHDQKQLFSFSFGGPYQF